jgi:hypothetical protein
MSEWELEDGQDDAGTYFFSSCHRFPPGASTRLVAAPALYKSWHRYASGFWHAIWRWGL